VLACEAKATTARSVMALVALPCGGAGRKGLGSAGKVDSRWRGGLSSPRLFEIESGLAASFASPLP
jgi:hypothetical protein